MYEENDDEGPTAAGSYDLKALGQQAEHGNKAYAELQARAGADWTRWEAVIIGLAALRDMACAQVGNRNIRGQNYRDTISALMLRPKYAQYGLMRRQERSACYKLMDHIHEITAWHATLPSADKLAWTHPETIIKHVPEQYLAPSPRHNQPAKPKAAKKPAVSAETERLRAILIQVIKLLAKHEPAAAQGFMDQIMPTGDLPDDGVEDI